VRSSKGFLLLEIIMAMVMIASGLLFVGRVYSIAKDVIIRSRSSFTASFLLEEKMFDLLTDPDIKARSSEGEFPDSPGHYWKSEVVPASPQDAGFFKVTVSVFDSTKRVSSDGYSLETYVAKKK